MRLSYKKRRKWFNYYLLGEKNIGAKAKVAMPCLYTTNTVVLNPSKRAALVNMASAA